MKHIVHGHLIKGSRQKAFSLPLLTSHLLEVNLMGAPTHVTKYVKWEFDPLGTNLIQSCYYSHPQKIRQKEKREKKKKGSMSQQK